MSQSRAKKVENSKTLPFGWDTSDEDEIQRRVLRADSEEMEVSCLGSGYFSNYRVISSSGKSYIIEIRNLSSRINSCSCADYEVNGLGTCKHIEKVLIVLMKRGIRKFKQAEKEGSSIIEIYIDPKDERIKLCCAKVGVENRRLYDSIKEFFNSEGNLISDGNAVIPIIKKLVLDISGTVRLSHRIDSVLENRNNLREKQIAREFFLKDVSLGKMTLDIMKLPLYGYQKTGMLHLAFIERAILADEMGLGKTLQAVAACELLRRIRGIRRVLIVSPASLKLEWEEQITKFSDLTSIAIFGNKKLRLEQYNKDSFFYLVSYEQVLRDHEYIQRIIDPDVIVLDEAQRIKNWQTQTALTIKNLNSRYAFVLSGTPIENRIDDIYSIMQFLDPAVFGSLFRFNRKYYSLDEKGKPIGYKNLDTLHAKLKPVLLRRLKRDIEGELPARSTNNYFVQMSDEQNERYREFEDMVARLAYTAQRRQLSREEFEHLQQSLSAMRILCDTPYIMDERCRVCPKLRELESILEELFQGENSKIIIFSEWIKMLHLISELLERMGIGFAWHTGKVDQKKRREEINRFKNNKECKVLLSTDSGSVGLNLQVANVVINVDLPWNPAKLEQRIARAWRKHQTRMVQVINLISENTIEHRMLDVLEHKKSIADSILNDNNLGGVMVPERSSLVTRLNSIMGAPVMNKQTDNEYLKEESSEPEIRVRDEIVGRFKNMIYKIDCYTEIKDENKKTLFIVIDGDENQRGKLDDLFDRLGKDQSTNVELKALSRVQYEMLCDLSERGILSFNKQTAENLYHSGGIDLDIKKEREKEKKRKKEAIEIFQKANRKYSMTSILVNNDFYEEAILPLSQTLELLLKSVGIFLGSKLEGEGIVLLKALNNRLSPLELPKNTNNLINTFQELVNDEEKVINKERVLELLGAVNIVSKAVGNIVTKINLDSQFEVAV